MSRAMLFSQAILLDKWEADASLREARAGLPEACQVARSPVRIRPILLALEAPVKPENRRYLTAKAMRAVTMNACALSRT
jgi:hypothetical protein